MSHRDNSAIGFYIVSIDHPRVAFFIGEDAKYIGQAAAYLVAQVSARDEASNIIALERLGILLSSACDAYMTLLANTTQDTIQLDGKPAFAVKKEK